MFRYKNAKTSLIIAALVILLCLLSISGATLALFTSNTDDGKIGINATSGKLLIDIVDETGTDSLVGEVLPIDTPDGSGKPLYEPGAVFYTKGFRVKNTGNISLNYIVYISEDDETDDDFLEAFDVWITKDPSARTDAEMLQEFEGTMLPAGEMSDVYYLVIAMKTSADNDFQNREITGVGITVCAVQGNGPIVRD